jgi:hypothetical protein
MLSSVASPSRRVSVLRRLHRRVPVQQQLNFLDPPTPDPPVWGRVDDERRTIVIDLIARLIAKAALAHTTTTAETQEPHP